MNRLSRKTLRFIRKYVTTRPPNLECERNPVGVHLLDEDLRHRVFGPRRAPADKRLVDLATRHLDQNGLMGQKTTEHKPVKFNVPSLVGNTLDEHFQKIGNRMSEPYLSWCRDFIHNFDAELPQISQWTLQSGWTRYEKGKLPQKVDYPFENVIVFDIEVLYKVHDFAVMATAVSKDAWYAWISPWTLGETDNPRQLLSLGPHPQVVIGHNVGYDRRSVKEEYALEQSQKFFLDTMSLHIATHGMCSRQRPTFRKLQSATTSPEKNPVNFALQKMVDDEPWFNKSAANGLADIVHFLLDEKMDKEDRDFFGELTREELAEPTMMQRLLHYCSKDSYYTKRIFDRLLPEFTTLCPHPVSFGALRQLSSAALPINGTWAKYLETAEGAFQEVTQEVQTRLQQLAREAADSVNDAKRLKVVSTDDPWLKQLDWTVKPPRYTKAKKGEPPRLVKNQKLPGKPQWFKDLFPSGDKEMNLTVRTRATTLLLRLQWDGHPLVWYDKYGWTFWTPTENKAKYQQLSYTHVEDAKGESLFKLPHPDGESGRCTNPLAKSYIPFFEKGVLSSENDIAQKAIKANSQCSYWISSRSRIQKQLAVYEGDTKMGLPENWGFILPRIVPMGTVTRRAVEDTWLTASNAKKNRIGSELKAMIRAPPGYVIIGADVDSEELWIASVIGDSLLGIHGGTALGWMTLEGSKKAGTDLHSRTASILNISRNEAKIFNYGRIYGAGLSFAIRLLRQFNPQLSVDDATKAANALYESTKGLRTTSKMFPLKRYWRGGTESIVFNQLELLAQQPRQRTPILGAGITEALAIKNLKQSNFLTSRINWSIQSSGVDYLHLLIASMYYLLDVYKINARLLITVHDEVRFLAKEEDAKRAALALQVANLWTRSMFCQQLGLDSMPYGVAFFSLIDIDKVLRKEVDDPCVTPSHPEALDPGTAIDIYGLVNECDTLGRPNKKRREEYLAQPAEPHMPVMSTVDLGPSPIDYLQAQIASRKEAAGIERKLRAAEPEYATSNISFDDLDTFASPPSLYNEGSRETWLDQEMNSKNTSRTYSRSSVKGVY